MTPGTSRNRSEQSLSESFERYLQDQGKGRGGDGGNYRRNAARELERFAEWAAGDRGADDWTGIVPGDVDRAPTFEDLDERVFREYARHLAGDRGLKQNTVQTYYRYISAWWWSCECRSNSSFPTSGATTSTNLRDSSSTARIVLPSSVGTTTPTRTASLRTQLRETPSTRSCEKKLISLPTSFKRPSGVPSKRRKGASNGGNRASV